MKYSPFLLHSSSNTYITSPTFSFVSCFLEHRQIKLKSIAFLKAKLFLWNFKVSWNARTVVTYPYMYYQVKHFEMVISLWSPLVNEMWAFATNCDDLC